MSQNIEFEEIDPIVGRMLELLKATPERDINAVRSGKSRFVSELNSLFPTSYSAGAGNWTSRSLNVQEPALPARRLPVRPSRRPAYIYAVFAVMAIILFLSTGLVTARAAENTLPGDALYPVKTGLEQARLAVTTDPDQKLGLYLNYAHRRLKEANSLIQIGRYAEAEAMVIELEAKVKSAGVILNQVEQTDPEMAEDLKTEMVMRLAGFSLVVNSMTNVAPPSLQPALNSALTSVDGILVEESGNGNESLPTGEPVDNGEGAAGAGETEPEAGNENAAAGNSNENNGNGQDNTNTAADPNANSNSNGGVANTNDNANANANSNSNANENNNGNANANQNDNGTGNGPCVDADSDGFCDDNTNANANTNANDNTNTNDNTNANDNGGDNTNGGDDGNSNDSGGDNSNGSDDDDSGRGSNNNGNGWGKGGKPK